MVTSEKHQKSLLGGIERFVGVQHPDLIPAVPKILMAYYQIDVLEEEVVKQWGTHVSKKYVDRDTCKKVRKASEPFLKVCFVIAPLWCRRADGITSGWTKQMIATVKRNDSDTTWKLLSFLCICTSAFHQYRPPYSWTSYIPRVMVVPGLSECRLGVVVGHMSINTRMHT